MPIKLMKGDITKVKADAIVNAANNELTPGCGVCGAIFGAAGCAQLEWACRAVGHCDTGAAVITDGFALPARYVIHTVGPVWQGGGHGEADLFRSCYQSAVRLAARHDCRSLAFPLISSGIYGYPREEAVRVALEAIDSALAENDMAVTLVLYDQETWELADRLLGELSGFSRNTASSH